MRRELNRAAIIAFLVIVGCAVLLQTKQVGARPCTPPNLSASVEGRATAFIPQTLCATRLVSRQPEYFSEGPLYNPTFTYSDSSLSFTIPTILWSARGKAVYAPSRSETVAPNTTTYWFLRVPKSSRGGQVHGSFVSSTSSAPRSNEVLEYTVVSDESGISWVSFPFPAQLLILGSAEALHNQPTQPSAKERTLSVAGAGVQIDGSGDVSALGSVTGETGLVAGVPTAGQYYSDGQIAVGPPETGGGLTGLFTAGTAGSAPNSGYGIFTFGNHTGSASWTQIGDSGLDNMSGVWNTVIGILEAYGGPAQTGCDMDAEGNWGCSGSLYGNAVPTPVPSSAFPSPTVYPAAYAGPAVIAQATSAPTAQPGYVLVNGTSAGLSHNACWATATASSGVPCEFSWSISSFSSGIGTTTVNVPPSSICTVTATQTAIVTSGDVMTTWVTGPSSATLTVHAQDLLGTNSATFSGNGNCN